VADNFLVGVVEAVVAQSAPLEALDQLRTVGAGQVENFSHPHDVLEHLRLVHVPRDAVEDKKVVVRMEGVRLHALVDADFPKFDRDFVGHQFAPAGILEKLLAERRAQIESAENVAARAVEITRHRAQRPALRSFAAARCAENQIGLVFAHGRSADENT